MSRIVFIKVNLNLYFVYYSEVSNMNEHEHIIDRIKQVRNHFDLTQDKFAHILNISRPTISNMENGTHNPSDQLISNICNEFGINEKWIKTGKGPMKKSLEEIVKKYVNNFSKEEAREALLSVLTEIENDRNDINDNQDRSNFTEILNLIRRKYQNADRDTRGWITVELKRTFLEDENK